MVADEWSGVEEGWREGGMERKSEDGGVGHLLEITAGVGVPPQHTSGTPGRISRIYPGVGAVNALP